MIIIFICIKLFKYTLLAYNLYITNFYFFGQKKTMCLYRGKSLYLIRFKDKYTEIVLKYILNVIDYILSLFLKSNLNVL